MDPLRTFLCAIEDFRQFGLKGFFTAEFCRIPATGSAWLCAPSGLLLVAREAPAAEDGLTLARVSRYYCLYDFYDRRHFRSEA